MSVPALDPGSTFVSRYRVVRLMKAGGMGEVHEALHEVTGRPCALKVMLRSDLQNEALRTRFLQEARVVSQVRSDHIVDVFDAGVDEASGVPFLVMELLEGEDLSDRVSRDGPLSYADTVTFLSHAALALAETHRRGIIHRDIKPSNLFVTRRNDGMPLVKVLDFGVAKLLPPEMSAEAATSDVGTPLYMAPEQFRTAGRVSAASDIYALGMLAYTLLVGAHYWQEEKDRSKNRFAFVGVAIEGPREPATVRAARRGVILPAELDAWFAKCTAYMPNDRFETATAAIADLAVALDVPVPLMRLDDSTPSRPVAPAPSSPVAADLLPETVEETSEGLSARGAASTPRASDRALPSSPTPEVETPSPGLRPPARLMPPQKNVRSASRPIVAVGAGVLVSAATAVVVALLARGPDRGPAPTDKPTARPAPAENNRAGAAAPLPEHQTDAHVVNPSDLPVVPGAAPRSRARGARPRGGLATPVAPPALADDPTRNPPVTDAAALTPGQRRGLYSRE